MKIELYQNLYNYLKLFTGVNLLYFIGSSFQYFDTIAYITIIKFSLFILLIDVLYFFFTKGIEKIRIYYGKPVKQSNPWDNIRVPMLDYLRWLLATFIVWLFGFLSEPKGFLLIFGCLIGFVLFDLLGIISNKLKSILCSKRKNN